MAGSLNRFVENLPGDGTFSVWAGALGGEPWLAAAADAQTLDLNSTVTIRNSFASAATGAAFSIDRADDGDPDPWLREGSAVALRWLAYRTLVRSSNLATNLLLEAVGLPAVSDAVRATGATDSAVARGIEDTDAREAGLQNLVTARDLAETFQSLADDTAASDSSCREILNVLAAQQVNTGIPAGLPAGTRVAHKTGEVEGVSHDVGIIYPADADPYLLTVCTTSNLTEAEGARLIADVASASWNDRKVSG